jgi:cellobiose phosphorylase
VRRYRGAQYKIHVRQTGEYSLTVNGHTLEGETVPFDPDKKMSLVEVTV